MDITIIGTGNMAKAIATRALAGRHSVTLLGTAPDKSRGVAEELAGDVLAKDGGQLAGKVVVDITNPIDPEAFEPLTIDAGSVAEEIAAKVPAAKVVQAFNTTFAGTLIQGQVAGQPLDVFLASDDDGAKEVLGQLVRDSGLRPVDVGPLARARELEALGFLHMALQEPLGTGFTSTIKVLS